MSQETGHSGILLLLCQVFAVWRLVSPFPLLPNAFCIENSISSSTGRNLLNFIRNAYM